MGCVVRSLTVTWLSVAIIIGCLCGLACQLDPDANGTDPNATAGPGGGGDPNAAGPDEAVLGRPVSFDITLRQGTRTLFQRTANISPSDPLDGSDASYYTLVPEYHYYDGWSNASVYLDVVLARPDDPSRPSSISLFLRAGMQSDVRKKSNNPLLVLSTTDKVSVDVSALRFEHNGHPRYVSVFLYPFGSTAAGALMLYYAEHDSAYYRLPGAIVFDLGPGRKTLQVPHSVFVDRDADYHFEDDAGWAPSVTWADMTSPPVDSSGRFWVMRTDGSWGLEDGEVFELGISAVVWRQEPQP